MAKCSQCDKPAVLGDLCVDHYYKLQQAIYLQSSMVAAMQNLLAAQLDAGTGYLVHHSRIIIPPPPSIGDNVTFNNINIDRSTVGAINTGILSNLDVSMDLAKSKGEDELAAAIKELTQAIYDSKEVDDSFKNDILDQLQFIVAQATAEPENRSTGLVKSVLAGIRSSISVVAGLLAIWDRVEPLIKVAVGIS